MPQRREAAIVGLYEYPLRVNPHVSAMQIKAECAARALVDAGLTWKDVDAVYDTGGDQGIGGLGVSEYFGFNPRVIDTTYVGGTSTEFQTNHARAMIAAGKCQVAVVTYGSTSHSDRRAIGTAGETGVGVPTVTKNMEDRGASRPLGVTPWSRAAICTNSAPPMRSLRTSLWPHGATPCAIPTRSGL